MQGLRLSFFILLTLLAGGAAQVNAAATPAYPDRPIRFIVPFPPGGSNDILSRYFGAKLTERIDQQVVIDNRAGANGIIGTHLAANTTPDGYTLLMISTSFTMNAAVQKKLPYDVHKDFDPITLFGRSPNSLVINPAWGPNTLKEIVERAKAKPGAIVYASTGIGGFNHFGGELFKRAAKIDLLHVPYKGGGPAMIDVMAGQIPIMFSSVTQVIPHVRSGKLKLAAVGASKRSAVLPDVPTFIESGYPDYEVYVWWGMATPAGVPVNVRNQLTKEFSTILNEPGTRKRLAAEAAEILEATPEQFRKIIDDEVQKWRAVATTAGMQVN